jgi:hypothetical protein
MLTSAALSDSSLKPDNYALRARPFTPDGCTCRKEKTIGSIATSRRWKNDNVRPEK